MSGYDNLGEYRRTRLLESLAGFEHMNSSPAADNLSNMAFLEKRVADLEAELAAYRAYDALAAPLATLPQAISQPETMSNLSQMEVGLWQKVVELSPYAIFTLDRQCRVLQWNHAAERIFGWTAEEIIGKPYPLVQPHRQEEFDYLWGRTLRGLAYQGLALERQRKDGRTLHILLSTMPLCNDAGEVERVLHYVEDVTERRHTEQRLQHSEEIFRQLLRQLPDMVYERDLEGTLLSINHAVEHHLGWKPADVIGRKFVEFVHPDDLQRARDHVRELYQDKNIERAVYRIRAKDGQYHFVEMRPFLKRRNGEVVGVQGIGQDVTDRVLAEGQLKESQRFIQRMVDATPHLIFVYNVAEHRNVYVNAQAQSLLGYTAEELKQPHMLMGTVHPDDVESLHAKTASMKQLRDGEAVAVKIRFRHKRGDYRWFHLREVVFSRMADGMPLEILGTALDITEQVQSEWSEKQARHKYESLVHSIDGIVWETDPKGEVHTFVSGQAERILGYPLTEWYQPHFLRAHLHPEDREYVDIAYARAMQSRQRLRIEYRMYDAMGRVVWFQDLVCVETDALGQIVRMTGIMVDITERKKTEQALKQSEERLRHLVENADDLFLLFDPNGRLQYFNGPSHLGFDHQKWIGMRPTEYMEPLAARPIEAQNRQVLETEQPLTVINGFIVNGEELYYSDHVYPVKDEEGRLLGVGRICRNITAQKRVEDQLRQEQHKLEQILASVNSVFFSVEPFFWQMQYISSAARWVLGLQAEVLLRDSSVFFERIHPEDREIFTNEEGQSCLPLDSEFRYIRPDGQWRWLNIHSWVFTDESGTTIRQDGVITDITARKLAEQERLISEQRYHRLFDQVSDLVYAIDTKGQLLTVSPSFERILKRSTDDWLGKPFSQLVHPDDQPEWHRYLKSALEGEGRVGGIELRLMQANGSYAILEFKSSPTFSEDEGKEALVVGIQGIARNVTDRRRAEAAQLDKQRFLELITDTSPCMHYIYDVQEERLVFMSKSVEKILGYTSEQMLAMGGDVLDKLIHPEDLSASLASKRKAQDMADNIVIEIDQRMRHANGSYRFLRVQSVLLNRTKDGRPKQRIGVAMDITELKAGEKYRQEMETKMQQAQKFESLGILAGGIAHDFNNLLTAILGNAGLVRMHLADNMQVSDIVNEIELAAKRAADLTQQMLAYAGKGRFVVQPLHLSQLVQEMAKILRNVVSKKANFQFDLVDNLPPVEADGTQIRQVVMNLITNASEALQDREGVIRISTHVVELTTDDLASCLLHDSARPGKYVMLEVSDTGSGMDAATMQRIFDPFFTTKFTGRGLGLSAVLGIIRGHRGTIKVTSQVNEGTTFQLYLPISTDIAKRITPMATGMPPEWLGTVMLVDQDESVLDFTRRLLERAGFSVMAAQMHNDPMRMLRENEEDLVLVVFDYVQPDPVRNAFLNELIEEVDRLPVLLISGLVDPTLEMSPTRAQRFRTIPKPFTPNTFIAAVRDLLSRNKPKPLLPPGVPPSRRL